MTIPPKKSWIHPKIEVKQTPNKGAGMFATAPIKEGEVVLIWGGVYTRAQKAREAKEQGRLVLQWDDDVFSVENRGDDAGYFINHSCDANTWMRDAYTLIAKHRINAGEEVTADYALWEADPNYVSQWKCACGSPLCRGKVMGTDWKRPEIQERYKNHFSPLINKRIAG